MTKLFSVAKIALVVMVTLGLAACGAIKAGVDDDISDIVGKQNKIYFDNQPVPIYNYSAQRDVVTQIYNITTPNLVDTWTVFYTFDKPTDVCKSRGYPIPYGVSLTSPTYQKVRDPSGDGITSDAISQPEPNGLYTDGITTDASWVICDYGYGPEVVYSEQSVQTYAHPVSIDDKTGKIIHEQTAPSVVLDLSRTGSSNGNIDPNTPDQNK
jgi:hypothetical protein